MFHDPKAGPPGIDRDIGMVSAALEDLHRLASDEQQARDGAKTYDFSIRWGVVLSGRLERLDHYLREGRLTEHQRSNYQQLRRDLKDATPAMERLGLGKPRVPLED